MQNPKAAMPKSTDRQKDGETEGRSDKEQLDHIRCHDAAPRMAVWMPQRGAVHP